MGISRSKALEPLIKLEGDTVSDYHYYSMRPVDCLVGGLIGFVLSFFVLFIFFSAVKWSLISGIVGGFVALPLWKKHLIEKRQENLLLQFKQLLSVLASCISVGSNVYYAFKGALTAMNSMYGSEADIVRELKTIISGLNNGMQIGELLMNFAGRSGLEDVETFAEVFRYAVEKGTSLKWVIENTRDVISKKIEMEQKISNLLSPMRKEFYTMMGIPFFMVLTLKWTNVVNIGSNEPRYVVLKLACMAIIGIAFVIGKKIMRIKE